MKRIMLGLIALLLSATAWADLRVDGTRVAYLESSGAASIRVRNMSEAPSLVQSWIDDGDRGASLEAQRPALIAIPPLFRLAPGASRDIVLRAASINGLPADRESLFWLNILEVPAADRSVVVMDIAMHIRMKIFYRPAALQDSPGTAVEKLRWRLRGEGDCTVLHANNPTPYHVSLRGLRLDGKDLRVPPEHAVLAPFSEWRYAAQAGENASSEGAELTVAWIDDDGLVDEHISRIGL